MAAVCIENARLRAVIAPDSGAGVLAFSAAKEGQWLPVMPDVHHAQSELKCSSFLMMPYSNRIENGHFTFEGREYQLERGEEHAIHGDVRTRAWAVVERTPKRLCCAFHSAEHEAVNWPWPFEAQIAYELRDEALSSHVSLRNRSETSMPAGIGWHPYFSRQLSPDDDEVRLKVKADGAYPDANGTRIPSGPAEPLAPNQDFSVEKTLAPDDFLDTCCSGYDGNGHIHWPGSGVSAHIACSPECTHVVLYNPGGAPHFAVEPVTNANNGVNLLARGWGDAGTVILRPGEALEARFDLRMEGL